MTVNRKTTHFPDKKAKEKALRMARITLVIEMEVFTKAVYGSEIILGLKQQQTAINMKIQILAIYLKGSSNPVIVWSGQSFPGFLVKSIFPQFSTSIKASNSMPLKSIKIYLSQFFVFYLFLVFHSLGSG